MISDAELIGLTAERLAVPRTKPADSFVLHSALELLARSALLPFVAPSHRTDARQRVLELGDQFEAFSDPVGRPRATAFDDLPQAARALVAAIDRSELDDVDTAASWLGSAATPAQLRLLLTDPLITRLAAAAHAPIFLYLLPRVAPRGEVTGELLRQLARELAGRPDWRLRWFERRSPDTRPADGAALAGALAATPRLDDPASTFIHPLMSRIDTDDAAGRWLAASTAGAHLGDRPAALLRVAAWSMISEPTRHAPYGWSHCLTMPQAALGVADACADPSIALAVAATYVAGFRTLADGPLRTTMDAPDPGLTVLEAIGCGPHVAAAAAWHQATEHPRQVTAALATVAAVHHDAHLVKYTLACLDAAAADPVARPLFLAAAASLSGWWATDGADQSP
ncbi:MAG: hypothetical protein JWN99_3053 [Ilumatobacteraceae bacterium]|nr:hypothetical protein [Ilumatobacteraceae bacterium]